MQILEISLENISCFSSLSLSFNSGFNIICGPNGVGKTTILDVIAEPFTGGHRGALKRRANSKSGHWKVKIYNERTTSTAERYVTEFLPQEASSAADFNQLGSKFIYLKTNRDFKYQKLDALPADRSVSLAQLSGLAKNGVDNSDLKGWLAQRWVFNHVPDGLTEDAISNLKSAISAFDSLDEGIRFVGADHRSFELIVSTKHGNIFLEYLSSGFKSSIFILLGLIKEIEVRGLGSAARFDGIILIDEIELHLHPTWQRPFAEALKRLLPHAQIIVTTHSPHVIQTAQPSELVALIPDEDGSVLTHKFEGDHPGFVGWTIEEILSDVMGLGDTRTPEYRKAIETFEQALNDEDANATALALSNLDRMLHPKSHLRKVFEIQAASVLSNND